MTALAPTSLPVSRVALSRRISDRPVRDQSWRVRPPRVPRQTQWQVAGGTEPEQELAG